MSAQIVSYVSYKSSCYVTRLNPRRICFTPPTIYKSFFISSLLTFSCFFSAVQADLILSAPPRESAEAGAKVYNPLAAILSDITGQHVVYKQPADWKDYQRNMKNDTYDFVFDGPHFAAWRIDSLRAMPLLRLPGSLQFVLVTSRSANRIKKSDDLIGQKICTLPSPNLGALSVFSMFPNPARQPEYRMVKGGFKEIAIALKKGVCDAAIFRSNYYRQKTSPAFRSKTRVIRRSEEMINQGITASHRIKRKLRNKIVKALVADAGKKATREILNRFHGKKGKFIPARKKDYRNQNLLKDNVIYGW